MRVFGVVLLIAVLVCCVSTAAAEDGGDFFEKNVRPVFARQCQACHSASAAMGGLVLDTREALLKGGARGPAIVPGQPQDSVLLKAVTHADALKMPPSGKLKDAEIAALTQWVGMGAPWGAAAGKKPATKELWSFAPPQQPAVPDVKNRAWIRSPIDAFILSALEAKGLQPAPAADKRTLLRRATFDLTGLPPTPEEVRSFLDDDRPDAFARVVDGLLASPRYGERWGRHWLDVARYADSNGLDENLVYRHAFRYRDYVIAAFNKDKPYDLFVKEQLAGDLLPGPASDEVWFERWTATGFLSLGAKMLAEDDPVKMQMDIVDEQLDTMARTFMGLTVGCARCHDHKFDPIPQADYYAMAGIFKSSRTMENFQVVAKWHEHVLAPEKEREALQAHLDRIEAKTKEIGRISGAENERLATAARAQVGAYLLGGADLLRYQSVRLEPAAAGQRRGADSFERGNVPRKLERGKSNVPSDSKGPYHADYDVTVATAGDYQIDMLEEESGGGTADVWVNGVLEIRGQGAVSNRQASPDAGGWSVTGVLPLVQGRNVIRLEHATRFPYFEALQLSPLPPGIDAPRSPEQVARRYGVNPGYLAQWVAEMQRAQGAPHSVLYALFAYVEKNSLDGGALTGWTSPAAAHFRGFRPRSRDELAARYQELFDEADRQWQEVKKARVDEPKSASARNAIKQEDGLADTTFEPLRELSYAKAGPFRAPGGARQYYPEDVRATLTRLDGEKKDLEDATPDLPKAMGIREGTEIADLPIHLRGSHWTLGEKVPRGFLHAIAADTAFTVPKDQSGRLQLAGWLTRADHPLTSRVMVNRLWRWHFGRGIVPSVDNFGRLGEPPANQPLLDWLARRFVEEAWSVKQMHRLILLSGTYQMSSAFNAQAAGVDPENTLLWRVNRRRLEAEAIRDAITAVSGRIDLTAGGTILDYKDRQYVSNTAKRGGADYDLPRRAVYLPVVRSSMYEMFQAFDLPDPSTPNGDRNSTVIAPQALFMMNATLVLDCTETLARDLLARTDLDDAGRVREAYERALARPPAPRDIDRALTFIARVAAAIGTDEADPSKRALAAWQSFCKALLASNEFIYVN